jgi:transposase
MSSEVLFVFYGAKYYLFSMDQGEIQPTYGATCLALRSVRWWCCEFTNGREDLNDNERSGRPRTSLTPGNSARVDTMVKADRCVHLKLISKELGISYASVYDIVHDSNKAKRMMTSLQHLQRYSKVPGSH